MTESKSSYDSTDPESQQARSEYQTMISEIEQRLDPHSNTVLIVDDEVGIRKFVARSIKKLASDIVIYEAEHGQQALERLEEIRAKYSKDPVFIVTDLNMPVMDGWELIDRLYRDYHAKGLPQGIPIIVLSSTSGEKGSIPLFRKSVHGDRSKYSPLIPIAKEVCTDPTKYATHGEQGLLAWIKQFAQYA